MDPAFAQDISQNTKFRNFLNFLVAEKDKFNSLDGLENKTPDELAIEVKARELAFNKKKEVLKPTLEASKLDINFNNKEYIT